METKLKKKRVKIVQIAVASGGVDVNDVLYALDDEGYVWVREMLEGKGWKELYSPFLEVEEIE